MALTPEELEERLLILEERNTKLLRLIRSGRAFTNNPLALATDLDDLGSVKTFLEFEEPTLTPGTPLADVGRMYGKDQDGQTMPYWISEDGLSNGLALPYCFRATKDDAQSIPSATWTKVEFDDEDYDVYGDYDAVTNTNYIAPVTGKYLFTATITLSPAGAGVTIITSFFVASVETTHGNRVVSHGAEDYGLTVTDVLSVAAGQTVSAAIWHNAGANRNTTAVATANHFSGCIVSLN